MEDLEPGGTKDIDARVEQVLKRGSQRTSRRDLLAKLGKLALVATGFGIADLAAPVRFASAQVDPLSPIEELIAPCSAWWACNLYGTKCCSAYCPEGATVHSCPNCSRKGGCWSQCCPTPQGRYRIRVDYCDCYENNCTPAQRDRCHGRCPTCTRGPLTDYYNGSSTYYMCTASFVTSDLCSG